MLQVFVYGTLKLGERNYHLFCTAKVIEVQKAIAYGKLYNLPMGYPAAIFPDKSCLVRGYLLTFWDATVLQTLDELEDYDPNQPESQNLYQRIKIEVYNFEFKFLGKAWTYAMNQQQIDFYGGVFIDNGWWTSKK